MSSERNPTESPVVWITGASAGIGAHLAREYVRRGARVILTARRTDRLEALAAELGEEVTCVAPADVTDEAAVEAAVGAGVDRFGRLDVAVANAGYGVVGSFDSITVDQWRRQMEVNVIGAVITAKAALPHLRRTRGRLAFVASVAAFIVGPSSGPYCASKAALRVIGQALAVQLAPEGVSVTILHPGFVESDIARVDNDGVFHPDRRDKRPRRLMWPADKAARVMADAITRRKREVVFTGHGKVAAFIGQHMPGLVQAVATLAAKRRRKARADHSA